MGCCLLCARKTNFESSSGGICHQCGSKPRDRALAWFFKKFFRKEELTGTAKILEVGPSPLQLCHFTRDEFIGSARYTAVDHRSLAQKNELRPPHRFLEMDVTRLTFSDQSFDIILCNHVFAFIRSDYQAMAQLHRCLKSSGIAILNAKVVLPKSKRATDLAKGGPGFRSLEERAEFGDEWIYGQDYFERLEAAGFFYYRYKVSSGLEPGEGQQLGIDVGDEILLCFKFRDTMEEFVRKL